MNKKIKLRIPINEAIEVLQFWVIDEEVSNAGLVSLALQSHIRRFLKGLGDIYLSEELQDQS